MPRSQPVERMCIVSREVKPADALIRFVLDPDGVVVADIWDKLPGRGVWVSASRDRVAEAERRKLFAKAFDGAVKVGPDLAGGVAELLRARALGSLGLARKSGGVVTGATKVETAIRSGEALAVLHAAEAAADGLRRIAQAVRASGRTVPTLAPFTSAQLDLALGGSNVIHAALLAGRSGEAVLKRVEALLRYVGAGETLASDRLAAVNEPNLSNVGLKS